MTLITSHGTATTRGEKSSGSAWLGSRVALAATLWALPPCARSLRSKHDLYSAMATITNQRQATSEKKLLTETKYRWKALKDLFIKCAETSVLTGRREGAAGEGKRKIYSRLIWHVHRQISVALAGGTLISTAATLHHPLSTLLCHCVLRVVLTNFRRLAAKMLFSACFSVIY